MSTDDNKVGLPGDISDWIASVTGGDLTNARQVPGGASREAWFVDVQGGTESGELFLRYDRRPPRSGSAFHTLQVEAEIMTALHAQGAMVPRVVAVHPELQAVLLERVGGQTWFSLIVDDAEQVRVAQDFISKLAALHRIDPSDLDIPSFGEVRSVRDHVLDEITAMRRRIAERNAPAPLLTFCIDWLERNIPAYDGPVVLVQGDTGPGNFMYADGGVTAIVDWELAHYGDPMDDIAWLSLRAVQDTFTHFPSRLAEYEQLSGHAVDPQRVWYYRLFAEARLATFHQAPMEARVALATGSADAGNTMIYGMLHRRLLMQSLAHAMGIDVSPIQIPTAESSSPYTQVYDAALSVLKSAATTPHADPLAARYTKGAARLVKYLREVDHSGPSVDEPEWAELTELLGSRPASLDAGRMELARLVEAGELDELAYVSQMWRSVQRDDYLMRTASGALYERTWPDLI